MLKALVRKFGSINIILAHAGAYVLFGMMLLTTSDVVGRYVLNLPITGAYEVTEAMMVTLVFLFLGHTQASKTHVAVDLVLKLLPHKIETVTKVITHVLSFLMMIVVAWMSIVRWLELMEINEHTPILGIPISPFLLILAFGCLVLCIELGKDIFHFVRKRA